jgi:hypothetical protein
MKDDGGTAFPVDEILTDTLVGGAESYITHKGMSLRDWFAGMALIGNLSGDEAARDNPEKAAGWSYAQADAMLAERDKT